MEPIDVRPLQGFRDFFPEEMALRNHLFARWREVARRYGFVEVDGPPLEHLELYTRKSGEEIVRQLYHFRDKGGREVALRPEMTPTLARMIAARGRTLPKPIKWFSIPQLFRYERKQRGRLREHFQLNMDIVGATEVEADVELLMAALDVQRALGLGPADVVARVNDRRIVAGVLSLLGVSAERRASVYGAIDKFRKVPPETFRALLDEAGASRAAAEEIERLCTGAASLVPWFRERAGGRAGTDALEEARGAVDAFERYLALLDEQGFGEWVEVDFSIVRGLAYYTGIVFELYDRRGALRAICGGGRYDDLIASLGGPDLPALGFGMGDVVLGELLKERGLVPAPPPRVDVFVVPVGEAMIAAAWTVTRRLRDAGIAAETPYRPAGVAKDLKTANQARAPLAAIVGPDEWAEAAVQLKDLRSGEERRTPLDALPGAVAAALG